VAEVLKKRAKEMMMSNAKIKAMFNLQYIFKKVCDFLSMYSVQSVHNVFIFSFARVIANVALR
jgi:hypothetical protein